MDHNKLQVFVDGTIKYFNKYTESTAKIGSPFLITSMEEYFEKYTAFISISGRDSGNIFFSSGKDILQKLLVSLNIEDKSDENMLDLVGEVANTISGNAREVLGSQFLISTPVVLSGSQKRVKIAKTPEVYVVPIHWNNQKAHLIISLN